MSTFKSITKVIPARNTVQVLRGISNAQVKGSVLLVATAGPVNGTGPCVVTLKVKRHVRATHGQGILGSLHYPQWGTPPKAALKRYA